MKYISFCVLLFLLISCENSSNLKIEEYKPDYTNEFFPQYSYGYANKGIVSLYVRLDDCGEWGGPEEYYKIYVDSLSQYYMVYERYRFNCDSISEYMDMKQYPLEFKQTMPLYDSEKKVVTDFFAKMLRGKVEQYNVGNGGSIYSLRNIDTTLSILFVSGNFKLRQDYYSFKEQLRLPLNKREEVELPFHPGF